MSAVTARLNRLLPHSRSQLDFLWFLLDARYGKDEAFTALVDGYLADKASGGWPA
jgi:hypothetical protein